MTTTTTRRRVEAPAPEPDRARSTARGRSAVARRLRTIVVALIVIVQVYPLASVLISALRPASDFAAGNAFGLPSRLTLENFARAWESSDIPRYVGNSLFVTGVSIAVIIIIGMMAAYALQVLRFRGDRVVLGGFLVGIVVPVQVALVPLFLDYSRIGLLDSYWSMIIPLAGFALPISIYLFTSFMRYIPEEMYEAASLDGAGPYRIFLRFVVPLSTNTIVTVVFVNAIFIWNDFIFANTFVLSDGRKTIPLGLQDYIGAMGATDWTATFAAVCYTVTPLLLGFLVLNKAIIYGIEGGATKG